MKEILLDNLDELGVKKIDYVVFNHAEPDHSAASSRCWRNTRGRRRLHPQVSGDARRPLRRGRKPLQDRRG
jgi:glyoxylase-like metal-dependent hydrolase (beta-lactamase superfamily II)